MKVKLNLSNFNDELQGKHKIEIKNANLVQNIPKAQDGTKINKYQKSVRKMQTASGGPIRPTPYLEENKPIWRKEYDKGIQKIPEIVVTGRKRYIMSEDPNHQLGFINAVTGGGLKRLSLTQNARVIYDAGKALAGKMSFTDWTKSLIEGNNGIVSDEFAEEHPYISTGINLVGDVSALGGMSGVKTLWNNGKLIQKDIPRKAENYYRAVDKNAIKDAKKSGVIRGRENRAEDSYPFFGRSAEPYHNTKYVIEGNPESADWISTYKYVYNKNPEIVKLPKIPDRDYSKAYDTIIGSPESNGFQRIGAYDNEFLEGYEALPMTNGQLNISPSSNFVYWKKHPVIGWRKYNFKQGGKI